MLKTIFDNLESAGFSVYFPSMFEGEVASPIVVIRDSGGSKFGDYSTRRMTYNLLCYAPSLVMLNEYVLSIEIAMKSIEPTVKPTYYKSPSYYDDDKKANMISIEYQNYRKI